MVDFKLPEVKFVPELDEIDINPFRLRKVLEDSEEYNADCRLWKKYDRVGGEIPLKYRGRNRYWANAGTGHDTITGDYTLVSVYDLDPETDEGRTLICRYRVARAEMKDATGKVLLATPLQTLAQAEKSLKAAQLEAERQERMAKKDPKLTSAINIHLPEMYSPNAARKVIDEQQNG